jgi:hypothetical protein
LVLPDRRAVGIEVAALGCPGAIAYQVPAWAWMILVSKPYLSSLRGAAKTGMSAFLIGHSWILVGALCAVLVYKFVLLKANVRES